MTQWSLKEKVVLRRALREMRAITVTGSSGAKLMVDVLHPLHGQFDSTAGECVNSFVGLVAKKWGIDLEAPMTPQQKRAIADPHRIKRHKRV